jgi:hypothetical protein
MKMPDFIVAVTLENVINTKVQLHHYHDAAVTESILLWQNGGTQWRMYGELKPKPR